MGKFINWIKLLWMRLFPSYTEKETNSEKKENLGKQIIPNITQTKSKYSQVSLEEQTNNCDVNKAIRVLNTKTRVINLSALINPHVEPESNEEFVAKSIERMKLRVEVAKKKWEEQLSLVSKQAKNIGDISEYNGQDNNFYIDGHWELVYFGNLSRSEVIECNNELWNEYIELLIDDYMDIKQSEIEQYIQQRGITSLVHFTRFENLPSILDNGLMTRDQIQYQKKQSIFNDQQRIDDITDSISISISFPNYKMFYNYRRKQPGSRWVVIKLDPRAILDLDVAFCFTNAASNDIRYIPLSERKSFEAFQKMFQEEYKGNHRIDLSIPDNYTTDPQAELLFLEKIPAAYIQEICFDRKDDSYAEWLFSADYSKYHAQYQASVNDNFFAPRQDYSFWSNNNHKVIRNYGNTSNLHSF